MLPGDLVQRGIRAKQLLDDALMKEAFAAVAAVYTAQLRACVPSDDLGRFRYAQALNIVEGVKAHLMSIIANGELTARQSAEFRRPTPTERVARLF